MTWYKRLFWKIFAAIWLVSTLSLLAAVMLIGAITEKKTFREVVSVRAMAYAERTIERYEREGRRQLPHRGYTPVYRDHDDHEHDGEDADDDHDHQAFRHHRHRGARIFDRVRIIDLETNQPVIAPPRFNKASDDVTTFNLTSDAGRSYRIDVDLDWEHSPFGHLLGILFSIQALLILIGSGLSALLISALIVRPLQSLQEHMQAITQGELASRSDRKLSRRQDELGELARAFDRMADHVEQTLNNHHKLMQDVSHELRAPLARLQAAAGLAEQRLGPEDHTVMRINLECQRLDRLIGELINLSKLDQMDTSTTPVNLAEVIQEVLQDQQFAHPERDFDIHLDSSITAVLNPQLLQRAVSNVVGNACKHTPPSTRVDVHLAPLPRGFRLVIRDHGPGVSDAHLNHLFEPFYRADTTTEGHGLGLSIAKRAMVRMGGTLDVRNHPDGGLEVTLQYQEAP